MGSGVWGVGSGEWVWGLGNGDWGAGEMGSGAWAMGSGVWGLGRGEQTLFVLNRCAFGLRFVALASRRSKTTKRAARAA